jgi:hypothetical protein
MPKQQTRTVGPVANSELAFGFWLARCFRDGSPEEDMFRAVCANSRKVGVRRLPTKTATGQAKALGASAFKDA